MTRHESNLPCDHARSHISDSRFHGGGYSIPDSRRLFCDVCRLQRWLDVEVALAQSQADLGMIPPDVAERITEVARIELVDLQAVSTGIQETGHSLVPLLRELERICGGYVGQFVHFGATTQDIQDTAQSLELRDVLDLTESSLERITRQLVDLAEHHRDHLMVGRTHAQPALPMTFGLKVAGWLDEVLRHRERLGPARERIVVAQLFGGVGTMAGFGKQGIELLQLFAKRLHLGIPRCSWHVIRDRIAEFASLMAMIAATLARIGDEIRTLSRPEFDEMEEGWRKGQVSSSTMPHKRNPEVCEQIVVLARLARAQVPLAMEAMIVDHERDYRGTRLEWPLVGDVSRYTLSALAMTEQVLGGLKVHVDKMEGAMLARAPEVCTEAMMLALGVYVGKQQAFAIVHELSQAARDSGQALVEVARRTPEIQALMNDSIISEIFDPRGHVGSARRIVDLVVSDARAGVSSSK